MTIIIEDGGIIMTDKEPKKIVRDMRKFEKKITSSSEKSKKLIIKAGICTPKGNLRKPYK